MELKLSQTGKYGLMEMIGQFWEHKDFATFDEGVARFLEEGLTVIALDMSRLSFISSQGLGRLVRAYGKVSEEHGRLVLVGPAGSVRETIEIAGFGEFMKICSSLDALDEYVATL